MITAITVNRLIIKLLSANAKWAKRICHLTGTNQSFLILDQPIICFKIKIWLVHFLFQLESNLLKSEIIENINNLRSNITRVFFLIIPSKKLESYCYSDILLYKLSYFPHEISILA